MSATEWMETPSGLVLPASVAAERYATKRLPIAIDFFAGAGGMSLGLKQAGYEVVAAADYDCDAVMTYATNLCRYGEFEFHFVEESDAERMEKALARDMKRRQKKSGIDSLPHYAGSGWISGQPRSMPGTSHLWVGDVRKISGAEILDAIGLQRGEVDLVCGGPPCQGYSVAGKREVMDPRNSLVFEFARLIIEINPKAMLFENVPGIQTMVTPNGIPVLTEFSRILEDGGFDGIDALKRIVAEQKNAGVAMRTKKATKSASRDDDDDDDDDSDLAFNFGGAA